MRTRGLGLLALLACACGIPRLRNEPPLRILSRERSLEVRLTSSRPGLRVYATRPDGSRGPFLGTTPLVLEHLQAGTEIWKRDGDEPVPGPPPPEAGLLVERHGPAGKLVARGAELSWSLYVEPGPGREPVRRQWHLTALDLEGVFELGRIELFVPEPVLPAPSAPGAPP